VTTALLVFLDDQIGRLHRQSGQHREHGDIADDFHDPSPPSVSGRSPAGDQDNPAPLDAPLRLPRALNGRPNGALSACQTAPGGRSISATAKPFCDAVWRRQMRTRGGLWSVGLSWCLLAQAAPPAFPGAEGFGATASGGRGGQVVYVTTLDPDPNGQTPGSLNWALRRPNSTVLFKVSGVIHAPAWVRAPNITIAGQTSPGGIIVRGLACDGHYERNDCSNLIVRHLRSRPALHRGVPVGGEALDDALRLDGIRGFIIDRSSFAHASDEVAQVSWASQGTIQNTILAETVGGHADLGGMLLNYSHPDFPQDQLSIHHNLWYRLGGRLPEITCEASAYDGEPGSFVDCAAHSLRLELANNLQWDPGINIWYTPNVDAVGTNPPYRVELNWIGNYAAVRPSHGFGFISSDFLGVAENQLFASDNHMSRWPLWQDWQLAYCCNDYDQGGPNTNLGVATMRNERHPFPPITYSASGDLLQHIPTRVGAFPHDPMDRRIMARIASGSILEQDRAMPEAEDAFALDFDPMSPPPPPPDSDSDGMPDAFENQNLGYGLNPQVADNNGTQLSLPLTGIAGYTNLEVYLNRLADQRSGQSSQRIFEDGFEQRITP
jgi:hypothetical protein